jgi:hypothetical protein
VTYVTIKQLRIPPRDGTSWMMLLVLPSITIFLTNASAGAGIAQLVSVGIATDYGLGGRGVGVRAPVR